jgi:tRNA threonylcarbamoyladenosine modification (KEOPS) complex  Pcc1 subunit
VRAELEIECADPQVVIRSIGPDMGANEKFTASLKPGKGSLKLTVESKDMVGLLAGINSYGRLIKTSTDVEGLEE